MDVFVLVEKRDISEENKKIIKDFLKYKKASGISANRLARIEHVLYSFAKVVGKRITEITQEDLIRFNEWLESQDYSENSKITFKIILKNFFRSYVFDGDLPRWISELMKSKQWKNNLSPQDLLKMEEIEKMLNATQSIRRKAILMTGYEGALRPHELLSLKVGDIEFTEWGARLFVRKSKTKERIIPLLMSAPLLAQYLRTHPKREDPKAPLWLNDKGEVITKRGFVKLLQDLAKKAGIKKRVYPYLLRHSRLTHLTTILKPSEIKRIAGWSNIRRLDTYEHLSSTDIEDALLKKYGIKKQEEPEKPYVVCPRCNCKNEPSAKYCYSCGLCLSDEEIFESEKYLEIGKKVLLKEHIRRIIKEEIRKMLEKGEIKL